jgi:beta-glucanase (GH16 family)
MNARVRKAAAALSAAVLAVTSTTAVLRSDGYVLAHSADAASHGPLDVTVHSTAAPTLMALAEPTSNSTGTTIAATDSATAWLANGSWPHATPYPTTVVPTATPSPAPTPAPKPTAPPPTTSGTASGPRYTFDEEFNGTSLSSRWQHDMHCCGTLAGYDPGLSTVADGVLAMQVDHRSNGWYGDLIDTRYTFKQKFGYFAARIKVSKGMGLWPAFWLYGGSAPEIDTMEICANPIGTNEGNDASELHTTVHWAGGATTDGRYYTVDLSRAYHVYAVDWRASSIRFYLDGRLVWTFSDEARIPTIALPMVLNLGVGVPWCGAPDSTTPDGARMLVDWVRVRT